MTRIEKRIVPPLAACASRTGSDRPASA